MSTIVVGVDGSSSSIVALRWAAAEAALRGTDLTVVHAYLRPLAYAGSGADMATFEPERYAQAERVLDAALDQVGDELAGRAVERRLHAGEAARGLIDAAPHAQLLVVGARGAGGFEGLLLGSTAEHCARHAPCPVVVVPDEERPRTGRIVVGVDGSQRSRQALAWAVDEAARRGAAVEVVSVYLPYRAHAPFGAAFMEVASPGWERRFLRAAERIAAEAVAEVAGSGQVALHPCGLGGHPAKVLAERAAEADLLVVGSRGRGGFAGVLLGSVSRQVLHHAPCPVVVVRTPGR